MFDFIRTYYGQLFSQADLPGFIAAGWLSKNQAEMLTKGEENNA